MWSHSSTFSIRATIGSHSPTISGYGEQQSLEARISPNPPPSFATPISFVSKDDASEDLGDSPRKKLRRASSSKDSQRLAQSSGGTELTVPNFCSPASILARLDLSHVPKNEFILALPSQVDSNWGIEYARPIMRRSTVISRGDSGADPSTNSINSVLLHGRKLKGPPSSGLNRAMTTKTTKSLFIPILDIDLEEDFLQEEMRYDDTSTDSPSLCGFRLKPRAGKLMEHLGTTP
jgi:hypothetical protein